MQRSCLCSGRAVDIVKDLCATRIFNKIHFDLPKDTLRRNANGVSLASLRAGQANQTLRDNHVDEALSKQAFLLPAIG